jgi:predicted peroxiredoxin
MAQQQTKYLFIITSYQGDLDRVGTALALANVALANGSDVLIWLTAEGAQLGKRGTADGLMPKSLPPVADLLNTYLESGGRLGICPPCGKTHGVTDDNLVPNGQWMGAPVLLAEAENRQTFSF